MADRRSRHRRAWIDVTVMASPGDAVAATCAPPLLHHWNVKPDGLFVQVSPPEVRIEPSCGVPEIITGGDMLMGANAAAHPCPDLLWGSGTAGRGPTYSSLTRTDKAAHIDIRIRNGCPKHRRSRAKHINGPRLEASRLLTTLPSV